MAEYTIVVSTMVAQERSLQAAITERNRVIVAENAEKQQRRDSGDPSVGADTPLVTPEMIFLVWLSGGLNKMVTNDVNVRLQRMARFIPGADPAVVDEFEETIGSRPSP